MCTYAGPNAANLLNESKVLPLLLLAEHASEHVAVHAALVPTMMNMLIAVRQ